MNVDHDNQLTGAVIGGAIAVHRQLGPGVDEAAYETALSAGLLARIRQGNWPYGLLLNFNAPTLTGGIRRITR